MTVPTLAQRVLPPMSLATPTTLPLLRPYGDPVAAVVEEASGPLLPFESEREGESGGTGAVREEAEEEQEEGVVLARRQSRECDVVLPWWGFTTTLARPRVGLLLPRSRSRSAPPLSFLFLRQSSARGAVATTPAPAPLPTPPPPLPAVVVHLKRLAIVPSFGVPLPPSPPPLTLRCCR